jgi:hypothetical protein
MTKTAVIEDWDGFTAFLAAQPLCRWAAQKQQQISSGRYVDKGQVRIHAPPPKNDNAALAEALSSMA